MRQMPPGWASVGVHRGERQVHLRYLRADLYGTPFAVTTAKNANKFNCSRLTA